jgi:hypothetical protein
MKLFAPWTSYAQWQLESEFAAARKNWWRQLLNKFTGGEEQLPEDVQPEIQGTPEEEEGEVVA